MQEEVATVPEQAPVPVKTFLTSRYMHKTLMPDEKIMGDARFPAIYIFICYFTLLCFAVAGGIAQYAVTRFTGQPGLMLLLVGAGVGFCQFLFMMMKMWTTEIVLTDRRLIYKRGFFAIKVDEVDIEQLASQKVDQNLIGRMFDYGEIHIRCIEASDVWLPAIAHPYAFVNGLEREKQEYREKYSKNDRVRRHGMNPGDK